MNETCIRNKQRAECWVHGTSTRGVVQYDCAAIFAIRMTGNLTSGYDIMIKYGDTFSDIHTHMYIPRYFPFLFLSNGPIENDIILSYIFL
jgi:hypothetical protein